MTGKTGHRQTRAAKQHPIGAPLPDETFRILGFVTTAELDKLMAKRLIVTRTVPERPEADGKKHHQRAAAALPSQVLPPERVTAVCLEFVRVENRQISLFNFFGQQCVRVAVADEKLFVS